MLPDDSGRQTWVSWVKTSLSLPGIWGVSGALEQRLLFGLKITSPSKRLSLLCEQGTLIPAPLTGSSSVITEPALCSRPRGHVCVLRVLPRSRHCCDVGRPESQGPCVAPWPQSGPSFRKVLQMDRHGNSKHLITPTSLCQGEGPRQSRHARKWESRLSTRGGRNSPRPPAPDRRGHASF